MKHPCLKVEQWGYGKGAGRTDIYVTTMTLNELEKATIDRWTRRNKRGYQRPPRESRFGSGRGSIVRYLLNELGAFPTSILINIRGEMAFRPTKTINPHIELGEIEFSDTEKPIVIDGQHRLEALKRASMKKPEIRDYPLPVSIMNLKDRFEEMVHFYIVNSRQKTIPTDLVFRQLQVFSEHVVLGGKDWLKDVILGPREQRAALASFIVDSLEEDQNSPFYNAIQYVGEEREPHHILRDYQLSRFISRILKEKALSGLSPERFAGLYSEYWSAIKDLYPESFKKPREYRLLKSPGIATYTYLFPTIFAYSASEGKITKSQFKYYLSTLQEEVDDEQLEMDFKKPIDDNWWSMSSGPSIAAATSEKIFAEIIKNLTKKIDLVLKKKSAS
jgi:DGQHR domain-containing protein